MEWKDRIRRLAGKAKEGAIDVLLWTLLAAQLDVIYVVVVATWKVRDSMTLRGWLNLLGFLLYVIAYFALVDRLVYKRLSVKKSRPNGKWKVIVVQRNFHDDVISHLIQEKLRRAGHGDLVDTILFTTSLSDALTAAQETSGPCLLVTDVMYQDGKVEDIADQMSAVKTSNPSVLFYLFSLIWPTNPGIFDGVVRDQEELSLPDLSCLVAILALAGKTEITTSLDQMKESISVLMEEDAADIIARQRSIWRGLSTAIGNISLLTLYLAVLEGWIYLAFPMMLSITKLPFVPGMIVAGTWMLVGVTLASAAQYHYEAVPSGGWSEIIKGGLFLVFGLGVMVVITSSYLVLCSGYQPLRELTDTVIRALQYYRSHI